MRFDQKATMVSKKLTAIIKACLPTEKFTAFGLHEPFFDEEEEKNLIECVKTRWVSYQGKFVEEFEKKLAEFCESEHAIVVSSGTVALFTALMAVGVKPGEEVLVPALTFAATANAIHHLGAIAHFVDSEYTSLGMDVNKLELHLQENTYFNSERQLINKKSGNIIRAIVPVHVLGHPMDMDKLLVLAEQYNLSIVEDGAESLGSKYKSRSVGSLGKLGILSFNGNKILTTGGGGAILVNDATLAQQIKHITTTAKIPHAFEFVHDQIGYNFRMPNINAALGVAQLNKMEKFIQRKRALAKRYQETFHENEYCTFLSEPDYAESNYWLNAILLQQEFSHLKNDIIRELHNHQIYARPFWKPLHQLEIYKNNPQCEVLAVAEDLYNRSICLPSSVFLYE